MSGSDEKGAELDMISNFNGEDPYRTTIDPDREAAAALAANLIDLVRRYCGARRRDVRLERQLADEQDQSSQAMGLVLAAKQSSPNHQAVRREQAVLLADALKSLPADYAEVIILHHLDGRSFPEVARLMSRSLDSVKKLWVRALARMRDLLEDSL
jgi:RNA polymerase sigma-70 factor (ECF subfamily)